jgi:hypothetical protein
MAEIEKVAEKSPVLEERKDTIQNDTLLSVNVLLVGGRRNIRCFLSQLLEQKQLE